VPDDCGNLRLARDAEGLVERRVDLVALRAHVGGIDSTGAGSRRGESDQLFGAGVGRRDVLEGGGEADRSLVHGVQNKGLHAAKFGWRGWAVDVADDDAANGCSANVAGEVDAYALALDAVEVVGEGVPVGGDSVVRVGRLVRGVDPVVGGSDRFAFAGNLGGDALEYLRGKMGIDEDGGFRLAKHVDEAGGNGEAVGVDGLLRRGVGEWANGDNVAVLDGDVSAVPGGAGAIDDVAVADEEIVLLGGSGTENADDREEKGSTLSWEHGINIPFVGIAETRSPPDETTLGRGDWRLPPIRIYLRILMITNSGRSTHAETILDSSLETDTSLGSVNRNAPKSATVGPTNKVGQGTHASLRSWIP